MIQANKLYKTYADNIILEDVTFTISEGQKVGFVAPNGTGKSTLFKIIQGLEEPDQGTVTRSHEIIAYLPQVLVYQEKDTIYSYLKTEIKEEWEEYKIAMALSEVSLDVSQELKIVGLSGGQKTKLGIAKLLLIEPTTLLLDEPTNSLDIESIAWLERFVNQFHGSILLISHDRSFLDATVEKILELDPYSHTITTYHGGYSNFVIEKKKRYDNKMEEYTDFLEKKAAMETWIKKKQQELSVHSNPKGGRQLEAMKKRYEREIVDKSIERPREYQQMNIHGLGNETHKKKVIFSIEDLQYHDLFSCDNLTITGGDKIHLQGRNGTGKTTFLRILLRQITDFFGIVSQGENVKIGYFAQEHDVLNEHKTVINEFSDATNIGEEQQVRKILAKFLFKGNHVFSNVSQLSQGEKVKLIIAELTHQKNQFLILDEPTNHLDIESREILEEALQKYRGGFIIISHDRYFLKQIACNKTIILENKKIQ